MTTRDKIIGAFWGGLAVGLIVSIIIEWLEGIAGI